MELRRRGRVPHGATGARERGIPSDVIARIPNKHSAAPTELLIWLIASQELRGGRGGIPSRGDPQNAALETPETTGVTLWVGGGCTRPWGSPQGAMVAGRESLGDLCMELRVTQAGGAGPGCINSARQLPASFIRLEQLRQGHAEPGLAGLDYW